jgi:predicted ATPase
VNTSTPRVAAIADTGVDGLDPQTARDQVRDRIPEADPEDVLLFDDLLGIADPDVKLPRIDPDARRRRLTALVNAASLARTKPALYVIEDALQPIFFRLERPRRSTYAPFIASSSRSATCM